MAATASRTIQTANRCREICTRVSALQAEVSKFLDYNSHQAIPWGTLAASDAGVNDQGYVEGNDYKPIDVNDAIGGLANINTAMEQWMENLDKVISP